MWTLLFAAGSLGGGYGIASTDEATRVVFAWALAILVGTFGWRLYQRRKCRGQIRAMDPETAAVFDAITIINAKRLGAEKGHETQPG
jgi:hypothetical protein